MTIGALTVDIGNSRIKAAVFRVSPAGGLELHASTASTLTSIPDWDRLRTASGEPVVGIVACSNPTPLQDVLAAWPREWAHAPRVISGAAELPLEVRVDEPSRVGIDRLLNAVAVNAVRNADEPAVIIDSGTATTIDAVSERGEFLGGAILPGIDLSAEALHRYTARLPRVTLRNLQQAPVTGIGLETAAAIHSGLLWGQLGAIRELIRRFEGRLGRCRRFLTGGAAEHLNRHLEDVEFVPHLGMHALARLALERGEP